MSLYEYLQLQPVEPQEDGSVSELDEYAEDETIDLSEDVDGATLEASIDKMFHDLHDTDDATS